ncbi:MAG: type I pullulanase, partial [Muribaculaceae bacterium]|nr:type I pullulanase [Muribaculaceae bacterium]
MTMGVAAASLCVSATIPQNRDSVFAQYPIYSGDDLELLVNDHGTHFTLWSPEAQEAILRIYENDRNTVPVGIHRMAKSNNGTWRFSSPDDLTGSFYTFQIKYDGKYLDETPGVWAKAVGTNGQRAAIIDIQTTNPQGWETDKGPEIANITDAIIYEMHHRDFSIHPSSGIVNKGKFLALTEPSTTGPGGVKTGIDHLKELGITHVHILPSYDYNSVDESNLATPQYNWGYDPLNYNAPEGSYSTNPADPAVRIKEMKQMIKALHDAGIGVIMDVVNNHTGDTDGSNVTLTAPG